MPVFKAVFCVKPGKPKEYFLSRCWNNDLRKLGFGWVWEDNPPEGFKKVDRSKYLDIPKELV